MESKKNTPNHIEKEGNNAKLKEELENLLEKELEKSPDEINTKKIDSIVHLLDEMDGKDEDNSTDKDEFAKRYLQDYLKVPKKTKIYPFSSRRVRMASAILISITLFGIGNYASVKATNQGILTNIKEKVDTFYFKVVKKEEADVSAYENYSQAEEKAELVQKSYTSWAEAKEELKFDFKIPNYIPRGFTENEIYYQKIGESDIEISRSYYSGDDYILFYVSSFSDSGKFSTLLDEVESIIWQKMIGGFYVTCYQIQDNIQAFFQDELFIYSIETNLNEEELEKFIMEIR